MRNLAVILFVLAVVGLSAAYWIDDVVSGTECNGQGSPTSCCLKSLEHALSLGLRSSSRDSTRHQQTITSARTRMYVNQYDDDADYINEDKRRGRSNNRELCIPWRSSCPSDSSLVKKYSFLKCCDNLACRCTLWGNNCKCESTLGGK